MSIYKRRARLSRPASMEGPRHGFESNERRCVRSGSQREVRGARA